MLLSILTPNKNDTNKIFRNIMILNTFVFFICVFVMLGVFSIDAFTSTIISDKFDYKDYLAFITALSAEQGALLITYFKTIKDKENKVLEIEKEITIEKIKNGLYKNE